MDQQQLRIYWTPGKENRGDYYTKHHPPPHHKLMKKKKVTGKLTHNYKSKEILKPEYSARWCSLN